MVCIDRSSSFPSERATGSFARRLVQFAGRCGGARVTTPTPESILADFGVDCPYVRGKLEATFHNQSEHQVGLTFVFRDYWQLGAEPLTGTWHGVLPEDAAPRFETPPPYRVDATLPRPRPLFARSAKEQQASERVGRTLDAVKDSLELVKAVPMLWPLVVALPIATALSE